MARVVDNFHEFEAQILEFEQEIPEQANQFKRSVALHILRGIALKNPVKTGHSRVNWQVGVNERPAGILDVYPGGDAAMQMVMLAGSAQIASAKLEEAIWVSNNLPYIEVLELGGPNRQAHAMVATTLAEIDAQFSG